MIQSIEEGRKEDGNRSIADKIIKRLHDLEKTVQHNHGRWAWELLQNAKDSVAETDTKVSVQIILDDDQIEFLHDGRHFTEKDIRGLINQISSKEVEDGQQSSRTGRFGTGFLTTHLLSKLVVIKGVVETEDEEYFKFNFPLNRNGKTTAALIPNIENAWAQFHHSTEKGFLKNYTNQGFNTSFTYTLDSKSQKDIARTGIEEFILLIPYVLTFIPEIAEIEITDNTALTVTKFQNAAVNTSGFINIKKNVDGEETIIRLISATDGDVSIAAEVKKAGNFYEVQSLEDIPKLFCDFPLIGSEDFHFPIVVNSFYFNPQTERDGVWLMGDDDAEVEENKRLLEQALTLYQALISKNALSFKKLYHLANNKLPVVDDKLLDKKWYREKIQQPLRDFLKTTAIVDLENGTKGDLGDLWFPMKSYSEEVRENLRRFTNDLFSNSVCKKNELNAWLEVVWDALNKISYDELLKDIANQKSIAGLKTSLSEDEQDTFDWLNEVGTFITLDKVSAPLLNEYAIIPNENGDFAINTALHIDQINDPELVKVLQLLGEDWNDILLHHQVTFGRYVPKKKNEIALRITEKLKNISYENPDLIEAISILSEWFDNNAEEGKDLFSESYRRRAELFMNTIQDKDSLYKVMRSKTNLAKIAAAIDENPKIFEDLERVKDLEKLMSDYDVKSLNQLREVLEGSTTVARKPLLPITQEILANMGITSVEEWEEAIADKNLSDLFSHQSTPTTDMFVYVQSLIKKAKAKIVAHLKTLSEYDLDEMDADTAPTILAGIIKAGIEISIVARPAYNGEVIIYYGSERDILDFEPSELWIDDGVKPRKITLGYLLKKARIVKFPV